MKKLSSIVRKIGRYTEIRFNGGDKKSGQCLCNCRPKWAFVFSIHCVSWRAPQKVWQLHPLCQLFGGTFVKLNKASVHMLKIVEPYTIWEYLNLKSVSWSTSMVMAKLTSKQLIVLTGNSLIARSLGQWSIIYMEDLIHEIYTVGKCFKEANSFL